MEVQDFLPYQQRVIAEMCELDEKIEKLDAFMLTDAYKALDKSEQDRLSSQSFFMAGYADVLQRRIDAFG
jgi:hypothetical protein